MHSENIVCFAKDWTENPTSCNHILGRLARANEVLWLNSISTRAPKLSSARDLSTILRKLKDFTRGPSRHSSGLTVLTPLVLPLPHSRLAARANQILLRRMIKRERAQLRMGEFQAWTFLPTAEQMIGTLGESLSVYYCTDEWAQFGYMDGGRVEAMERTLCAKVDLVFAAARSIVERKKAMNPETHWIPHGVDRDHFASALAKDTPVATEMAQLPRPIVGFFGLIEEWIDTELFVYLAQKRPEWSIVVIGQTHIPLDHLPRLPNLHVIGRRPYAELPAYAKAFSVGLCPFRINALTQHVNPIKLREYLSAGVPVVSSDIPECRVSEEWGRVARNHEEFLAQIETAIKQDSPEARRARSEAMRSETWDRRIEEIGDHVMRVKEEKRSRRASRQAP